MESGGKTKNDICEREFEFEKLIKRKKHLRWRADEK